MVRGEGKKGRGDRKEGKKGEGKEKGEIKTTA